MVMKVAYTIVKQIIEKLALLTIKKKLDQKLPDFYF